MYDKIKLLFITRKLHGLFRKMILSYQRTNRGEEMNEQKKIEKEVALESVITTAVQIPGVKVDRKRFLTETFAGEDVAIQDVIDYGPIQANVSQDKLRLLAGKLILKRTSQSSIASFVAGIPGGLAMAATIPADVLQFFGMALRLAQELSYLYGAGDLWKNGQIDDEKVKGQLLLYCGAMFGVSGAVSGVRVLSTQLAKTALKKLPQQALTKTFWYPMLKQIGKALSIKVTKTTLAQGVSKAIPVVGGVISGGLNFASMMPMANRLQAALDSASFGYSEEDLEQDIYEIENMNIPEEDCDEDTEKADIKAKILEGSKKLSGNISGLFAKKKVGSTAGDEDIFDAIKKLAELKESGILTQEEFEMKKAELLAKL